MPDICRMGSATPLTIALLEGASGPITPGSINRRMGTTQSRETVRRYRNAGVRCGLLEKLPDNRKSSKPFKDRFRINFAHLKVLESRLNSYEKPRKLDPYVAECLANVSDRDWAAAEKALKDQGEIEMDSDEFDAVEKKAAEMMYLYDRLVETRLFATGQYHAYTSYGTGRSPRSSRYWSQWEVFATYALEHPEFRWETFLRIQFWKFDAKDSNNGGKPYPLPFQFRSQWAWDLYEKYGGNTVYYHTIQEQVYHQTRGLITDFGYRLMCDLLSGKRTHVTYESLVEFGPIAKRRRMSTPMFALAADELAGMLLENESWGWKKNARVSFRKLSRWYSQKVARSLSVNSLIKRAITDSIESLSARTFSYESARPGWEIPKETWGWLANALSNLLVGRGNDMLFPHPLTSPEPAYAKKTPDDSLLLSGLTKPAEQLRSLR